MWRGSLCWVNQEGWRALAPSVAMSNNSVATNALHCTSDQNNPFATTKEKTVMVIKGTRCESRLNNKELPRHKKYTTLGLTRQVCHSTQFDLTYVKSRNILVYVARMSHYEYILELGIFI